jgi:hypothetical protein
MRASKVGEGTGARQRLVTMRLSGDEHAVLVAAAACAAVPVARLARMLVRYGLEQLDRRDPGIERAIKVSRD